LQAQLFDHLAAMYLLLALIIWLLQAAAAVALKAAAVVRGVFVEALH
jgi:hypothetical protein